MTLSILHRLTGIALFFALIVLTCWLMAAAAGPSAYARAMTRLASLPVKGLIALALLALCYHFCNGLRHLAWDVGWGFERAQARRSAYIVLVVAVLAAAICLYWLFASGPGTA